MKTYLIAAAALFAGMTSPAMADPIEGMWKMPSGYDARIAPCGGAFCLTYTTGPHRGKTFGQMQPTGNGSYQGSVTDYTKDGKQYSGKGQLSGNSLSVSGCVLGGLICRSQALSRM